MSTHVPQNFYRQTVAQDWSIGTGNFYVTVKPTVSSGYMTISPASATLREIVFFTATGTDGTGDYITISLRGQGGTTEQTHIIGETVRMNVGAETIQEIVDDIAAIVAGGAVDASTTTKGIVTLNATPTSPSSPIAVSPNGIVFETGTGTSYSLTTVAGEKVIVFANGVTTGANGQTVTLLYNGVSKNTIGSIIGSGSYVIPWSLMYTETPGAGTHNITITGSAGQETIMVIKIKTQ